MLYQGPEEFEPLLRIIYSKTSQFFPRNETPQIIVGGLAKIHNNGNSILTEPDYATIATIDETFRNFRNAGFNTTHPSFSLLQQACEEANILRPNISGEYNNCLDIVVLSPQRILDYIIASRKDTLEIKHALASGKKEEVVDYFFHMNFPNLFIHELAHWDSGASSFNHDLRKLFRAINFQFDIKKDGKFSYETGVQDSGVYKEEEKEAHFNGKNDHANLSNQMALMVDLGIHEFGEISADLIADSIIPPSHGIVEIKAPYEVASTLISQAQKGPRSFMLYVRQKINMAYEAKRNVFELL